MRFTPLKCAMAMIFGVGGLSSSSSAFADFLSTGSSSLNGSTTVAGVTQSSPGPTFDLTNTQYFYTCLCVPYSTNAVGDLNQGIISVQSVTDQYGTGVASETYTTTITNNGTTAQSGDFNFYLGSASLIASPTSNFMSGPGSVSASFDATIAINGQTAWSYGASLSGSSSGSFAVPDFTFSPGSGGPTYSSSLFQDNLIDIVTFAPYSGEVSLGTLAPGQSEVLTYTLSADSDSSFSAGELAFYGGALAQVGDPFSVQGQGLTTFGVGPANVVAAVPEPGTEVMFVAGLALLGGIAARRRIRQHGPRRALV